MLKKSIFLLVIVFVLSVGLNANALTLKKGTLSLGGASTLSAVNRDSDRSDSTNVLEASATIGYFIMDNFEFGGKLGASYIDYNIGDGKEFSISPYITYHFDLNETSNIYLTGMIGISRSYSDFGDYSRDSEGIVLASEIGWEYFFSPSVSGTVGVRYEKTDTDYDIKRPGYNSDGSDTYTTFGTILGLKVYF